MNGQIVDINNTKATNNTATKVLDQTITDWYSLYHGDTFEVVKGLPNESVGLTVTSPPFPSMYVYNNSPRDLGNNPRGDLFMQHFSYLAGELLRITQSGRSCLIHLTQTPLFKGKDDYVGLMDFRGDVIRLFQSAGWIYYGEITIDKNPQVKASRTKEHSLLFKTLSTDSSACRVAMADYLLHFKKPGENKTPIAAGSHERYNPTGGWITSDEWILWARPCWYGDRWYSEAEWRNYIEKTKHIPEIAMPSGITWYGSDWNPLNQPGLGIRETDVLNVAIARDKDDERHLCPLQLHLIERCIKLWSNPGDIVFDPFNGIGSTGYEAIRLKRKYLGCELKESYYKTAIRNLESAVQESCQLSLFDLFDGTKTDSLIKPVFVDDYTEKQSDRQVAAVANKITASSISSSLLNGDRLFEVVLEGYNDVCNYLNDEILEKLDRMISESERVYLVMSEHHELFWMPGTVRDDWRYKKVGEFFKQFQPLRHRIKFWGKSYNIVSIEPYSVES